MPSYYAHKRSLERAASAFISRGDNQKAIDLVDKYFEAFPHMNFKYDSGTMSMLSLYIQAGSYEHAKPHMEILADEMEDFLRFYQSLSQQDLNMGFAQDQKIALQVSAQLQQLATQQGDTEYVNELKSRFDVFQLANVKG